jgi:hypothetical protein
MKIPIKASPVRLLSSVKMRQASGTFMAGRFPSSVLVAVGNEFHRTVRILRSPGQPPVFDSNALAVDKTGNFVEGDKLEVVLTHLPAGSRPAGPNCSERFSGRLKRRFSGGNAVLNSVANLVTPFPWPIELGEHVSE